MDYTSTQEWYAVLVKPSWAPPSWLFGPVWTVLYAIIAVTFGYVAWLWWKGDVPFIVLLPFLLNLAFNAAFTPVQFGLRSNELASVVVIAVVVTLVWALIAIYPYARFVAYANIPYLLWGSFATVLQLTVTYLNR